MPISSDLIIGQDFADHLAYGLAGTETVNYYIHDEDNSSYSVGFDGYGYTFQIPNEVEDYMASVFDSIDKYIDLDFTRVYTDNGSELDIYSLYSHTGWDSNTVGTTYSMYSDGVYWFDIAWKHAGSDFSNLRDFDKNTIIHEIGHSLGLDHPDGEGYNPAYTSDDTVMSYNIGLNGWSVEWTQSDIDALVRIWGEEDDDNSASTDSNDTLTGSDSGEIISGLYGDDIIDAGAGDDVLYGNQGNDKIIAGTGEDKLYGGKGNDSLYGNQGDDTLCGNIEDDFLYGGQGTDNVYGNQGADRLYGNKGVDVLYGGKDNDYLDGGEGDDILYGNIGGDCFYLSAGEDKVMDFNASEGDWILIPDSTCSLVQQGDNLLVKAASGNLLIANHSVGNFNGNIVAA